jgi:hypothetical protein
MRNSTFQVRTRFSAFSVRQSAVPLSLLFILFLLVNTASATQAPTLSSPSIEWQHTYGLGISQAIQTSDGGFALTGSVPLNPSFTGYPWLLKTDSQGNEQWNQSYTKYPDLNLAGVGPIIQTSDGGYLLGGSFYHAGAYLLKTDSKGNVQWIQSYPSREYVGDLIKTPDVGYVISGPYVNGTEGWMAKVDSTGAVQWSRDYNGVFIYRIVQAKDGGYAMICEVFASDGLRVAALIKTDSGGKMIWNQTYGSSIQFIRFLQTTDSGYALVGNTFRTNTSQGAALLTKTDSLGNVVWNQTYSQFGEETIWSIAKTSDGGYALGCSDHFIGNFAKVDEAGNLQWNISYSFDSPSNVRSVMQLRDGSYVFLAGNALIKTVSYLSLPFVTPTKTIPDISTSINPSPTPTVPEFPSWTIPLMLGFTAVFAGLLVYSRIRKVGF